jgi:hypothetical protein
MGRIRFTSWAGDYDPLVFHPRIRPARRLPPRGVTNLLAVRKVIGFELGMGHFFFEAAHP